MTLVGRGRGKLAWITHTHTHTHTHTLGRGNCMYREGKKHWIRLMRGSNERELVKGEQRRKKEGRNAIQQK